MDVIPSVRSVSGRLEVRLFGHADVLADGVPIKFAKRTTALALVTYLVLRRGQTIARDSLAFLLFPDADEPVALASLRRCLYLLTRALPEPADEPWIVADPETVRWNDRADASIDLVAFERYADDPDTYARAIELYTGDLLEDVYDDWVLGDRERLRARYLAMLSATVDRCRARRDYGAAIGYAKRLLASDLWREDALRTLVAIRYESGDTAGALAEYERFERRLRDDLAIAPMAETVALRRSILHSEAVPGSLDRPSSSASETVAPRATILPFVGRRRELATLYAAWTRAASGTSAFALVRGEAGVGKTRVTAELARTVAAEGGRVFVGTTASPESTPYQAIVEAFRSALPLVLARPPTAARREILGRLIPELRDPAAATTGDVATADVAGRDATQIFEALTQVVRGLASPRPLLLVLEDLQWASHASIDALASIVRETTRSSVFVVATCRDEETPIDHPLRALHRSLHARGASVVDVELDRFDEAEVTDLIARVDGLSEGGDALVRSLFAQSEGNALFLNEAISETLERGGASVADRTSVASIVASRVARLGDHARVVAEIVAVAGTGAGVSLVREVSNLPAASVARGLDELLDRRILREAGRRANLDYVFTHHLIGDAIYADIERASREQRHARIARVLEARANEGCDSREIARHAERGSDAERAARWYAVAARESAAVYAHGDAIDLATRALALAPATDARRALLEIREDAHGRRADRAAQRADIDDLERLAGDDDTRHGDVLFRRVLLARALGESETEGRHIEAMIRLANGGEDAARARALAQVATHHALRSRPADALESARAALELYERLEDVRSQLDCLATIVDCATNLGDHATARHTLTEMHRRAASVADRAVEAKALSVASMAALLRQEYRESIDLTTRELAIVIELGEREREAGCRGRIAVTAARLGDFVVALREFDLAFVLYEAMDHTRGIAITHTNRATLLLRIGRFEEALASIERSNVAFETVRERRTIVANRVNASFAYLQLGDANTAKALAVEALEAARDIGMPVFEAGVLASIGNAERALGNPGVAIGHMRAGLEIRRRVQEPHAFIDDLADLTVAYLDAGRPADALVTAEELEAIGKVSFDDAFWAHYAWWTIARAYAANGLPERAGAAYDRARNELARFAQIVDDRSRPAFLDLPINRQIAAR